jgi:hypothetical protein
VRDLSEYGEPVRDADILAVRRPRFLMIDAKESAMFHTSVLHRVFG